MINQAILSLRNQDKYDFEINIAVNSKLGDNPIYKIKPDETGSTVFQSDPHKQNIIITHDASSFTFDAQESLATSPLFMLKQPTTSFDKQFTMNNFKFIFNKQKSWFSLLGSVTLTLSGAHFENNSYTPIVSQGENNSSTLNLTNCDAYNNGNITDSSGGFVKSSKTTINMNTTDPTFMMKNNKALHGGVFYLKDSSLNITYDLPGHSSGQASNVQIIRDNNAKQNGGFIYAINSNINFSGTTGDSTPAMNLYGNSANKGGAIWLNNSLFTINSLNDKRLRLDFRRNNRINPAVSGGAIYLENNSAVTCSDTTVHFYKNSAIEGGGIYMQNGIIIMDEVIFDGGNTHGVFPEKDKIKGGAIYATGNSTSNSTIDITTLHAINNFGASGAVLYLGQNTTTGITKSFVYKNNYSLNDNCNNLIYIETPKPSNTLLFDPPMEADLSSIIYPLYNSMACRKGCEDTSTTPNSVAPILCSPGDSNFVCNNFNNDMEACIYHVQGPNGGPYYNCFYDDTNNKCKASNKKCLKQ